MKDSEITAILELASSDVASRDLSLDALREAKRRTRLRRALAAGVVAAAVALAVFLPGVLADRAADSEPLPATPSPSPSLLVPTPTQTQMVSHTGKVWPVWDPFTLAELPLSKSNLSTVAPPANAPSVLDQPVDRVLLAHAAQGQDLRLLGSDGAWRSLPGTAAWEKPLFRPVRGEISPSGEQVAYATLDGVIVLDVSTGEDSTLEWPKEMEGPWDYPPELRWMGDHQLLVTHWKHWRTVTLSGHWHAVPYQEKSAGRVAADQFTTEVHVGRWKQQDLRSWSGDKLVRQMPSPWWGERFVAAFGLVAFTGGGGFDDYGTAGPMVVDTNVGERLAYLPIRERNSEYSDNGYLTCVGFLDVDTVLIKIAPMRFGRMSPGEETWHLVAWNFRTNEMRRLLEGDFIRTSTFAPGLITAS